MESKKFIIILSNDKCGLQSEQILTHGIWAALCAILLR